jgi:transposase-like protein
MTRRGRKPLALEHVQQLDGSERAKQRLTTLLKTLQCDCTVGEACAQLGLSESHFHAVRHHWLQGALQLLEPHPPGRRPKERSPECEQIEQLEQEVRALRRELALTQAQCEVTEALGAGVPSLVKKGPSIS